MIYRYFIHLAYKGTNYHGWQIQPNANTIQAELERALGLLLGEKIHCIGAGRTDTGVHASNFYAHFDTVNENLHHNEKAIFKLNCILPHDIGIYDILAVKPDANARFDAISRTYHYRICQIKNPFNKEFAMHLYRPLNMELMNEASLILLEYTDFTSFSKVDTDTATNNCSITHAQWTENGDEKLFTITANRFLRNMVRAIVGTLLDVGQEKIPPNQLRNIIENKNRCSAGMSAKAQGLHLINILYKNDIFLFQK